MYDLAIIGAGWAGVSAALEAKRLGRKVCLIEKAEIGGVCLNRGCIPTKALFHSAKLLNSIRRADTFGIKVSQPEIDFLKIQERKAKIVRQLSDGLQFLLKGIEIIKAEARLLENNDLLAGRDKIRAKSILVAVGSKPAEIAGFKFDSEKILSSDDILNLKKVPASLLIIGGGVIGCEFAGIFSALGSEVTIAEKMPRLLPGEDEEVSFKISAVFKKRGVKVNVGIDALSLNPDNYNVALVCVGRKAAAVEGLDLKVNEYLQTDRAGVYAAGDCASKVMLAHYAAYQGRVAAFNALGGSAKKADNAVVPNCIWTDPEIASVGSREGEVKKFSFQASGIARILEETEGFIKIVSDKKTRRLLGASIVGPHATELIAVVTTAVSVGLSTEQFKEVIFAHPTLSEGIAGCL